MQTERLGRTTALAEQLAAESEALRAELTQRAGADPTASRSERALVRESVADLAGRVAALYEIVQPGGAPTPAPGARPAH